MKPSPNKTTLLALWLAASAPTVAVIGDLDNDGCVWLTDLVLFASSWLDDGVGDLNSDDITDMADWAIFSAHWLGGCPHGGGWPPTAQNVAAAGYTYDWTPVVLAGSDDGMPNPPGRLRYVVVSYPTAATLFDPAAGAGVFAARHLPYRLSSWGDTVWLIAEQTGQYTFQFKVNDGGLPPTGGDSVAALASVTLAAWPQNCLSLDGRGFVQCSHDSRYTPTSGWAVHLWYRTRRPNGGLIGKTSGSGTGWQIDLVSGRPVWRLTNSDGQTWEIRDYQRRDNGQWQRLSAGLWTADGKVWTMLFGSAEEQCVGDGTDLRLVEVSGSFANTEPLRIGRTPLGGYAGEIDKVRFFAAFNPENISGMIIELDNDRQGTLESALGFGVVSVVRYKCDEGSGTTIADDKGTGLTGSFSDSQHVRWMPYIDLGSEVLN